MKKLCLILLTFLCFYNNANSQILCIYCYDQNDSISTGVNNLVKNGGFENSNCLVGFDFFCPNSTNYNCDIINWTCTGGGINTYAAIYNANVSIVVEGNKAAYFGNYYCNSCSSIINDTSCLSYLGCTISGIPSGYPNNPDIGYGGTTGVSLEQTITGLTVGNTYILEFWAGGEGGTGGFFAEKGLFAIDVGFGDTLLRNKPTDPLSTGFADTIGTRYIIEFNATSSSHTIKFTNWGHICIDCTELILDDVRLYTLAELSATVPHCTAGIADASLSNSTSIYPNPITNELNIKTNSNQPAEIILYDITSRKLLQETFTNTTTLNTTQLAKGIYIYEVRNKSGVLKQGKVVKE